MNVDAIARERQFAAFLAEACGQSPPADLGRRIATQLAALPVPTRSRRRHAVAAALAMLGIGVVLAVASWRSGPSAALAQDPERRTGPARVVVDQSGSLGPTGSLAVPTAIDVAVAGFARLAKGSIACARPPEALVVDLPMQDVPWREAIDLVAAKVGYGVREYGGVLAVGPWPSSWTPGARITIHEPAIDARTLVRRIAEGAAANVVMDDFTAEIQCKLDGVPWREALELVATAIGAEVVGTGTVLLLRQRAEAPPRVRLQLAFTATSLHRVATVIGLIAGDDVVVADGFDPLVSLTTHQVGVDDVVPALAAIAAAQVDKADKGWHLQPAPPVPAPPLVRLALEDGNLPQLAELCAQAANVTVFLRKGLAERRLSAFLHGASAPAALGTVVQLMPGVRLREQDGILMIE